MRCSVCRRIDRAVFARLFPERSYLLLCGVCLDHINAQIADGLQHRSLGQAHYTESPSRSNRSGHFWTRLAGVFLLPMRKIATVR
jgi:hypothetical protein